MSDSVYELRDTILRLQLVQPDELRECEIALAPGASESDFFDLLQRRQLLTGFQVEKLKKRSTQGLVLGGYKLLYRNAAGSFARVYRVCSIADGSMAGIKVLRERWAKDQATVQLFRREGEIGKRLKHPNIVPIYDVGYQDGYHFITMEFVEGGNLRDFLKIRRKLEPEEASRYILHMSDALSYALSQGVTHRDLKLTNVLLSSQGVAKLIDFGLAADESTLNRPHGPDLQQALEYSTLEKGTGVPQNDPRSDLYFLGTIFYELVTGQPPYPRTRDRDERKRFNRYRDIRPVTALEHRLPGEVVDVIDRLLQINPSNRYQRPEDVAADLRKILNGEASEPMGAQAEPGVSSNGDMVTLLCLENRPKHQDILRQYFSSRGYRVLLMGNVERALARIKTMPPDSFLIMGRSIEGDPVEVFHQALEAGEDHAVAGVLVLSERQSTQAGKIRDAEERGYVLTEPVPLGIVRRRIEKILSASGKNIPQREQQSD